MTQLQYLESVSFHSAELKNLIRQIWTLFTNRIQETPIGNEVRVLKQKRLIQVSQLSTVFKEDADAITEFLTMKKVRERQDKTVKLMDFGKSGLVKHGYTAKEAELLIKADSINQKDCPHCPNEFEKPSDGVVPSSGIPVVHFKVNKKPVVTLDDLEAPDIDGGNMAAPKAVVTVPVTESVADTSPKTSTPEELDDKQNELLLDRGSLILKISKAKTAREILDYFGYVEGENDLEVRVMMRSFMEQMGVVVSAAVTRPVTLAEKWIAFKEKEETQGKLIQD